MTNEGKEVELDGNWCNDCIHALPDCKPYSI